MHTEWVRAVIPYHISWDALAEIGLDSVYPHSCKFLDAGRIPLGSLRISEVYDSHTGLPQVTLENRAVPVFQEISLFAQLTEYGSLLSYIRVYPDADLYPS